MSSESNTRETGSQIAKGGTLVLISRILQGILGAVFSIWIARLLGADAFGMYKVVIGLVGILGTFSLFGIKKANIKLLSKYTAQKDWNHVKETLKTSFKYLIILGVAFSGGLVLFSGLIASKIYNNPELITLFRIGALCLLGSNLLPNFWATFRGFLRLDLVLVSNLTYQISRLIGAVAFVYLGFLATGAVLGVATGYFVAAAASLFFLFQWGFPKEYSPDEKERPSLGKEILSFSGPVWVGGIAGILLTRLGPVVLGSVSSMAEAGYFGAAFSLSIYAIRLPGSLGGVLLPKISDRWTLDDKQGVSTAIKTSLKLNFVVLMPLIGAGIVFSKFVILLVYGQDFIPANTVLRILLFVFIFWALDSINHNIITGIGRPKMMAKIRWICAGIGIPTLFVLANIFGAFGAAVGLGVGVIVSAILGVYYSEKLTGIDYPLKVLLKPLVATVLMILFLIPMRFLIDTVIGAILTGFLGFLLYFYIFLKIGGIKSADIGVLEEISDSWDNPWIVEKLLDFVRRYV